MKDLDEQFNSTIDSFWKSLVKYTTPVREACFLLTGVPPMPISGLAITLSDDHAAREAAMTSLRAHSLITLGQREGHRLPIVVETPDSEVDRDVWDWLHALPGVRFVDVACVHFTDEEHGSAEESAIESQGQGHDETTGQ